MKIQYCSDLHLEFPMNERYLTDHPLKITGEILILAGDIVPLHHEYLHHPFFSFISDSFRQTFWIPGNHEFYHTNMHEFSPSFHHRLKTNISLVGNIALDFDGIRFIFSTLWSHIHPGNKEKVERSIADFEVIRYGRRNLSAKDFNFLHNRDISFIRQSLEENHAPTVVVTHHLPSPRCNHSKHANNILNGAFCSDQEELIKKGNAAFWIYGHSHFCQKPVYVGNTILLTNQLGYVHLGEHQDFRRNAFFSV
jgi:predicted phosphodiesterase